MRLGSAAILMLTACVFHPTAGTRIATAPLNPRGLRPGAFQSTAIHLWLAPAISDSMQLQAVGLSPLELVGLRDTLSDGLPDTLRRSFAQVELVDTPNAPGLLLRIEELSPQHVKTGNVPVGHALARELRFDISYSAALVSGDTTLHSAIGTVEGRDLSWHSGEWPLMLQRALERSIDAMLQELFANEMLVRASGRGGAHSISRLDLEQPTSAQRIAVMPLRTEGLLSSVVLDELLVLAIDAHSRLNVISAADINELLGHERMRDAIGCDDVTCAAEIGGALGAGLLLTGNVGRLGSQVIVTLHLIDSRNQSSLARGKATVKDDEDLYQQAIDQAVRELLAAASSP